MPDESRCPDPQSLRDFALGKLDPILVDEIGLHVSVCDRCAELLDQPISESLVDGLRELSERSNLSQNLIPVGAKTLEELQSLFAKDSKYEIIRELGSGGMGSVYLARHSTMRRKVAIKVIRPELIANEQAIQRFRREVQAAARLSHPNVVKAFDADQASGTHFLVMEFVDGESLDDVVRRNGPLSSKSCRDCLLQVARGLKHAHEQGMIHRDIKPANLIRSSDGQIKIADFGLARHSNPESEGQELTVSGMIMGSVSFTSPEQARDPRSADIRSDMYSLGCTMFFLATGHAPYRYSKYMEQVAAHQSEPFPNLSEYREDFPRGLIGVISKLVAKQPEDRYQNPDELLAHLQSTKRAAFEIDTSAKSERESPESESVRLPSSRRVMVAGLAASLCILVLAILYFPGAFSSSVQNRSATPAVTGTTSPPKVLLVVSATSLWYSDYAPVREALESNGVECLVASNQTGIARIHDRDPATERSIVHIDQSILELADLSRFDAVVFMGSRFNEFTGRDSIGNAVAKLLNDFRGKKWIASIGTGINIPIHHGVYDRSRISASKWIDASNTSNHQTVPQPVVIDRETKAITAEGWDYARELGQRLSKVLP